MFRRNKVVFLVAITISLVLLVHPVASQTSPVASFTFTPTTPIFGQIVVFNASASYDPDGGTIVSYKWDFDDGIVYTVDEPVATHNYTNIGTYNVTLIVTDDETQTDTTWQIVKIRDYPVAVFTHSPESPVVGETVTFNASLSTGDGGAIMNYTWDFGDSVSVTETDPIATHVYTDFGTYNATLIVTDDEGLTDTCFQSITVRGYPVASFIHSPDRPLINETATFDASSSTAEGGTIVSYEWDFDDGSYTTGEIVTHKYTTIGTYNVTLTVTDTENLMNNAWTIVTVRKHPYATFIYSPDLPLVGETVTFNASLSTGDGGAIMNYTWDFGDSVFVTETDPIATHVYTDFGTYNVTLTVEDSEDLADTFMDIIRISIIPVADFTYSPTKPIINETVTFDASASYDPDRSIVSHAWDFGDGNVTVAEAVITHAYAMEGTYNVTLTVTDDDGLTDTMWKLITVYTFLYTHDVAITSVTPSATTTYIERIVNITVVAKNEGTAVESFTVTAYYNFVTIGTQPVTNLLPNEEIALIFIWNTTDLTPSNYTLSAQASVVPGETETTDNNYTDGGVVVTIAGDVNGDGIISASDIILVGNALFSNPGDPNYDPLADVNGDGKIGAADIIAMGNHLFESWP